MNSLFNTWRERTNKIFFLKAFYKANMHEEKINCSYTTPMRENR